MIENEIIRAGASCTMDANITSLTDKKNFFTLIKWMFPIDTDFVNAIMVLELDLTIKESIVFYLYKDFLKLFFIIRAFFLTIMAFTKPVSIGSIHVMSVKKTF